MRASLLRGRRRRFERIANREGHCTELAALRLAARTGELGATVVVMVIITIVVIIAKTSTAGTAKQGRRSRRCRCECGRHIDLGRGRRTIAASDAANCSNATARQFRARHARAAQIGRREGVNVQHGESEHFAADEKVLQPDRRLLGRVGAARAAGRGRRTLSVRACVRVFGWGVRVFE